MPPKQPIRSNSYIGSLLWRRGNDQYNADGDTQSLLSKADVSKQVDELQKKLDESTAALDAGIRTIASLEERVRTLSASLETAQADSSKANGTLRAVEDAHERLRTEYVEQAAQMEQARQQADRTQSALEAERTTRVSMEERMKITGQDRDQLGAERDEALVVISTKDAALQDADRRLQSLVLELRTTQDERVTQSERMAELEVELSMATKAREELRRQTEDSLLRLKALQADVEKMHETIEAKDVELQAARDETYRLSEDRNTSRTESAKRIEELTVDLSRMSDALDLAMAQAHMDAEAHARQLEESERRQIQESEEQAARQVAMLQTQQENHRHELEDIRTARREEIEVLAAERDGLLRQCDASHGEVRELREMYEHVSAQADTLRVQCEEQVVTLQEVQTQLSETESSLSSALQELESSNFTLEKEIHRLHVAHQESQREIEERDDTLRLVRDKLRGVEQELARVTEEIDSLRCEHSGDGCQILVEQESSNRLDVDRFHRLTAVACAAQIRDLLAEKERLMERYDIEIRRLERERFRLAVESSPCICC
ncbi:hypothetical protein DAEQUDRAFT_324710 [Daedalea quercina L-15889]|uniref:Uncharacterized protein n=1 Tax=Daedalea quercina L-15889 TaxID=1314783 RepID=A0A165PU59_9APHY|nr:hypothetical protein DAEQUDRAFT_324710 [Daedalea quercina L-15889]